MTLEEMKNVRDEDIDFGAIPETDAAFWEQATVYVPDSPKTPLNLRLDTDMVEWFRGQGKGYQTRMNAVLRSYYQARAKR